MHFEDSEKQTIQELVKKLEGVEFNIETMKEDLEKTVGGDIELWENTELDKVYYQWVLYYQDVEIGLDTETEDGLSYVIKGFRWHEA